MSIKKLRFNTIRSKLIISFILICLIPLTIVGNVFLLKSISILDRKLQLTSLQTLNEVNFGLDNYFVSMQAFTNSMATNNSFVQIDEADNLTFAKELLKSVKESHGDILSTYVGTESGKYANYPVQKMADNYDATKRPWYMEAKANMGKIILTLPYKDAATNKIVVSCAKAIENNGKFIGVVSMDISVDILTKQISSQAIGSTGYLFMCDTTGNVIAHPDNSLIGTNYSSKLSFWNETNSKDRGFTSFKDQNGKKFVFYETNKITGWKTIALMDDSELTADVYSVLYIILIAIFIMLIISIIMSILLSKGISINIKNLKEVYSKVSQGDFSVSIETKSKDEFKDLANDFNLMIHNISSLMEKIKSSSKIVFETSSALANMAEESTVSIGEVSKAIGEVSQGAVNQAESAQHGAAQIQELSSELDVIIQGNTEMDKLSATTQDLSSKGLSMVKELIEKSNKTKSSTAEVFEIVLDMDKSTSRINDISNTISAITAQTNLLSLNASIEAARAGEAGRGFSVVADEIRKLADQSKNSTEEIKAIIETIQSKSETAVNAIESTESIVIEQENAVKETQEIFTRIINAISAITENVKKISTSVGYVTSKKETVQDQIQNISSISEETAAASQQVSASSEELNATMAEFTQCAEDLQNLSQHLEEEVEKFKTR